MRLECFDIFWFDIKLVKRKQNSSGNSMTDLKSTPSKYGTYEISLGLQS